MVDDEKLMEWIQKKLDSGVSEDRIRKSLRNTGHDPSLVEKAKDPFAGEEGPEKPSDNSENSKQTDTSTHNTGKKEDRAENKNREAGKPDFGSENSQHPEDQLRKGNNQNQNLNREKEEKQQRNKEKKKKENRWKDSRNYQQNKNNSRRDNNSTNTSQNNQKPDPQQNRQKQQRRKKSAQQQKKNRESEGGGISMPEVSAPDMPSVPKPNMSALPLKTIAIVSVVILVGAGGFAAFQSGMMSGLTVPELPFNSDNNQPEDTESSTDEVSSSVSCSDIGVRVKGASTTGSGVTANVQVFVNEQIQGTAELYSNGNLVDSQTFQISDEKTVEFSGNGDQVVFRPSHCNRIRDTFSLS